MVKKKQLSVSIVLPNWNGAQLLAKNLPAVLDAAGGCEVIVTDDASSDESLELLRKKFPSVIVVSSDTQQGFAGNVNRGVVAAHGEIIVLINTDVQPKKNFLGPLLANFSDPEVFAVGCLEQSHEKEGVVLRGRGEAHWENGYFIHQRGEINKTDTAWASGGSSAFRKSMWEKLDGMDTLFNPFYWEDIDLSYRAKKAGWKVLFEPKSIVDHFHEQGAIKTAYTSRDIKRIAYRNQYIFIWKNLSDASVWLAHMIWTPIKLFQALFSGDFLMLQGYLWAIKALPDILEKRSHMKSYWVKGDLAIYP